MLVVQAMKTRMRGILEPRPLWCWSEETSWWSQMWAIREQCCRDGETLHGAPHC